MSLQEPSVTSVIIDSLNRLETKTDSGFAGITAKMESKADKADIAKLDNRLDNHEKRIEKTETALRDKDIASKTEQDQTAERKERKQGRFNMIIGALSVLALFLSIVIGVIH